ncbi:TAF1D isoform 2, partial [Pan troglodytes]
FSSARLEEVGWLSGVGGLRSGGWCVQSSRTHAPGQSRVLGRGLGYEQQVRGWGHCEAFLEITLLIAAYLKLSVSLTHLKGRKETPFENLFIHLKVFTQVIQVTHLLNQYH